VTAHDSDLEAMWRDVLTNPDSPFYKYGRIRKHFPGDPRCKLCKLPLGGISAPILKLSGRGPSKGNPRFCNACERWAQNHPGGAEIELTLLFADVRGSTRLAEDLGPREFASLMQRFYRASTKVLIGSDAFLDKPVGDEIIALYFPLWGEDHAARGLLAAQELMIETGHADADGPWIPTGVGLHTGVAYVGTVGVEGTDSYDVTVLGDAVNVTARITSLAGTGEVLISDDAYTAAGLDLGDLEHRILELKGRSEPLGVHVLTMATAHV
jgi:adenylate cyclase